MDRARIKTFLLLLLLAVNLVFLALIVTDRIQEARLQSETRTELVQALERLGIDIDYAAIPDCEPQPVIFIERDTQAEDAAATAILGGPAQGIHEGGGIYRWTGTYGEGETRQASFWFALARELSDTEADFQRLLEAMDVTVRQMELVIPGNNWEVTFVLTEDGLPVMGSQITFSGFANMLFEVSGTALWGERQRYAAGPQLDVTTALIALAGHLQETHTATRFERVEMGYDLLEGPGYLTLRPIWIVATDGGTFLVDRQSGEIR